MTPISPEATREDLIAMIHMRDNLVSDLKSLAFDRNAVIEECAKCIPTTWLDPLLSGPKAVARDLPAPVVELLLTKLSERIRALTLTLPSQAGAPKSSD